VLDECIYFMLVMEHMGTNKVKINSWSKSAVFTAVRWYKHADSH